MEEMWKTYYENGAVKEECPIRYGSLNGIATLYNQDGTIKEKRIYSNDMLMGNIFRGNSSEGIATKFGIFLVEDEECNLSKKENNISIEINEELASILFYD